MKFLIRFFIIFIVLIFSVVYFSKPFIIEKIELTLSEFLEQKVKIQSVNFFPFKASIFIKKPQNSAKIILKNISPIELNVLYSGDIDAFSVYHPLKGAVNLNADVLYGDALYINAQSSLYGSATEIKIDNLYDKFTIDVFITHLDIEKLKLNNGYDFNLSDGADANLTIVLQESDILADLSLMHKKVTIKDFKAAFNTEDGNFQSDTRVELVDFPQLLLSTKGVYKDSNLSAELSTKFDKTNIELNSISYVGETSAFKTNYKIDIESLNFYAKKFDTPLNGAFLANGSVSFEDEKLEALFTTESLGGELKAKYLDDKVAYVANALHLSKLLALTNQDKIARGYLYLSGELDINKYETYFDFYSPRLTAGDMQLKEPLALRGNVNYKNGLKANLYTNYFKSEIKVNLENENINLYAERLDVKELLEFAKQREYASGKFSLEVKGDFDKLDIKLKTENLVTKEETTTLEQKVDLELSAAYVLKEKLLNSEYKLILPYEGRDFKFYGDVEYQKKLDFTLYNSDFDAKSSFIFDGTHFEFNSKNLNLKKVLATFKQKPYVDSYVDISADGDFKDVDISLHSDLVQLNREYSGYDANVSMNLQLNYTPELLTIKPEIKNKKFELNSGVSYYNMDSKRLTLSHDLVLRYEKQVIPIKIDADVYTQEPYNAKALIVHKNDRVKIDSFIYENEEIKTVFNIDIKELSDYETLIARKLYGPLVVKGEYEDSLVVKSSSFGGDIRVELKNKKVSLNLSDVELVKIAKVLGKKGLVNEGLISGMASYDIKNENANTQIEINNAVINGIDIDKKLLAMKNTMGLNIFGMGKGLLNHFDNQKIHTKINHLLFDTTLKDETITLDDVAFSTNDFLIVAQGDLNKSGVINELDIRVVGKEGCALISQDLKGNISSPEIVSTTSTALKVVTSVPSSILNTGEKIVDFATKTVDKTASFTIKTAQISDKNISLTSDIVDTTKSVGKFVSPINCKKVYKGKVKHPYL